MTAYLGHHFVLFYKKHSLALEKATLALLPLFLDSAMPCSFSYHAWHDYFQGYLIYLKLALIEYQLLKWINHCML